ncbi:MAG: hypothetical protein HKN50_03000 [Gammaproteobacteria bacterium]|nr:hypothetical protein [Gammaproteobacteria bacterium]
MRFNWQKQGLLYRPAVDEFTHGSHPCITHVRDDLFIVAFTRRNAARKSHIFLCYAEVSNGKIILTSEPKLALSPGNAGCFDCDGVISVCFVENDEQHYLYYVGWQNLPDGLWICDTGRSVLDVDRLSLAKEFPGPVLGRDKSNPLFAAATAFYITDNGLWHTWYNSGIKWEKRDGNWHHEYGIHYAHSRDGINWECKPGLCIPFADEYEYAFGRPSVVFWNGLYHMWYAHRATKNIDSYRIGFASSEDGVNWVRDDANAGIDVSDQGWDSEMICYPYVFKHKDVSYMLYNGNDYGRTGFGYAVLQDS